MSFQYRPDSQNNNILHKRFNILCQANNMLMLPSIANPGFLENVFRILSLGAHTKYIKAGLCSESELLAFSSAIHFYSVLSQRKSVGNVT